MSNEKQRFRLRSPRLPAAKKQKVREMVPTGSDEEDDSEDAKLKLTSNGKKRGLVMQDSESGDSLPAGRGRGRGSSFTRVKLPEARTTRVIGVPQLLQLQWYMVLRVSRQILAPSVS